MLTILPFNPAPLLFTMESKDHMAQSSEEGQQGTRATTVGETGSFIFPHLGSEPLSSLGSVVWNYLNGQLWVLGG